MTPEQLDEARAREAYGMVTGDRGRDLTASVVATVAARLAREGWEPVDPDLIEARGVAAGVFDTVCAPSAAKETRGGRMDDTVSVLIALAAIKRGRELERGP